jgi:hypothetical protein
VPLTAGLFRAHVGRRAGQAAELAIVLVLERQPEIGQVRPAQGIEQDVGRLDIAVDQPVSVGVMQCFGDPGDELGRIPERGTAPRHPGRQVAPLDVVRDHEAEAVVGAPDIVDRHDVGMIQPGENPRVQKVG